MKAISLVFEYDFNKQKESGRTWGEKGYKSKDFIFEYSAASFATFAYYNPGLDHEIMTDDKKLLEEKMSIYSVNWSGVKIIEEKEKIKKWKEHRYCFYPAMMHLFEYKNSKEQILKLDNDLECLSSIDVLKGCKDILMWKKERNVNNGREYWGERTAARKAFGTDNFILYNMGVFGIPGGDKKDFIEDLIDKALKMSEIDISNVVKFPELPAHKSKIWSCSEQTGYCYVLDKRNMKVRTVENLINHHCYGFNSKKDCIESAKFLRKNNE